MDQRPPVSRRSILRHSAAAAGVSAGAVSLLGISAAAPAAAQTAQAGNTGIIPVSNVRDFGATGNGTTDDTAGIQAAIDQTAASGGGIAYLPTGTYAITGISLRQGVDLIGASRNSSVLLFTPASGDAVLVSQLSFSKLSTFQVRFAQPVTSGAAIHLDQSFTIQVSDIFVNDQGGNTGYDDIFSDQSTATFIDNFNLYGLTHAAVWISGPSGNDVYLSNGITNLFQASTGASVLVEDFVNGAVNITDADLLLGQYAMLVSNSNYMRFENTYFDSSAQGVVIESGNLLTFANCWFFNRPGSGLTIGAARGVNVTGGQAVNCGANGIHVSSGARYVTLSGVQVVGNNDANVGADGILVDGTGIGYVSITGCAVGNDPQAAILQTVGQQAGIHVTRQVVDAHYVISNNVLFGNRIGGVVDEGRGPKYVAGNVGNAGPVPAESPSASPGTRDLVVSAFEAAAQFPRE